MVAVKQEVNREDTRERLKIHKEIKKTPNAIS